MSVKFFLESKNSKCPVKTYNNDAGFDLSSSENIVVPSQNRKLISTGIKMSIPEGYYGRVAPRSGMSVKGFDVGAGVIDLSYRGTVKVLLVNNTDNDLLVRTGDRIAQLVIEKIYTDNLIIVDDESKLGDTDRGKKRFRFI